MTENWQVRDQSPCLFASYNNRQYNTHKEGMNDDLLERKTKQMRKGVPGPKRSTVEARLIDIFFFAPSGPAVVSPFGAVSSSSSLAHLFIVCPVMAHHGGTIHLIIPPRRAHRASSYLLSSFFTHVVTFLPILWEFL